MNDTSPTIASNNTSSSTTEEVPSKQEGIAICSVFVLEAALIVVGNLLTIVLSGNASGVFKGHQSNQQHLSLKLKTFPSHNSISIP